MIKEYMEVTADMPPIGALVECKNDLMEWPVLATRGHIESDGTVSPNLFLFSLVQELEPNRLVSIPKGTMCVPTKWRWPDPQKGETK